MEDPKSAFVKVRRPGQEVCLFSPKPGHHKELCSHIFLWMVRVLRDFRRRSISPATRRRRAAVSTD
eukprot:16448659-Heterocapsa_arctica.AAC.1